MWADRGVADDRRVGIGGRALFLTVSAFALVGRVVLSLLPVWVSGRVLCAWSGFFTAAALAGAGLSSLSYVHSYPVFVACIAVGAFFFNGIWVVISPYVVGIYPTRLAGRAIGTGRRATASAR